MVMTSSTMLLLGTKAPDFSLPDVVSGKTLSLASFENQKALLVMFICQHCPFVQHIKDELAQLGRDYQEKPIGIIAISSNDAEKYPDDAPEQLKAMAQQHGFTFPFCYDASQETAKAYTAACTPDFFLFGNHGVLLYRGQLDDSRPESGKPVTGKDLRVAIDAVLAGKTPSADQRASIGCNIKWKPGNEPAYFG